MDLSGYDWSSLLNFAQNIGGTATKYLDDASSLLSTLGDAGSTMFDNADFADSLYNFSPNDTPIFDKPADSSIWDSIKNSIGNLTAKDVAPAATIGGGMLSSGISDMLKNRQTNKSNNAAANAAKNYMNALQGGKDEAKSQFLQNLASQRSALGNKVGNAYSLSGGANTRGAGERLRRQQNESLGEFLLNLAQQKTPDLSAYTQASRGGTNMSGGSAFLQGLTSGLGKTAGNIGSIYASNWLKSLFA